MSNLSILSTSKELSFSTILPRNNNDSSSDGTGLGMAIVYKLVQAHNGTISVESESSEGTSFNIVLPKKGRP
ncbi:hypothetical protein CON64_10450 [Bacillus pseudomycoides]|nr:hypothetical protein CON64_10450 [Bacillus pseudomycoides]